MAASTGDKVTDTRNAARPNSARATGTRTTGGLSLACDNLAGWPTASKVHFVTYQIDSNSKVVVGTQLDCSGIVSGNTIGSFAVIDGTDTGNSVNDVVEMLPTAAWGQDLADALTNQHSRTGAHVGLTNTGGMTTDTLTVTSGTTLPAGDIVFADLLSTIFSGQVSSQVNAGTAGGTMSYINLGGIKLLWLNTDLQITTTTGAPYGVTFPVGFFSGISAILGTANNMTLDGRQYISVNSFTTTSATLTYTSAVNANSKASILVIGT